MSLSDVEICLPSYLFPEEKRKLLKALEMFPDGFDSKVYSDSVDKSVLYQGDCIKGFVISRPMVYLKDLPENRTVTLKTKKARVMLISNTCDISQDNRRLYSNHLTYAPISTVENYENILKSEGLNIGKIKSHIESIKRQEITSRFYLPSNGQNSPESIALLDQVSSCIINEQNYDDLIEKRTNILSDYGFYVLLFSLSRHYCRFKEEVHRGLPGLAP